MTLLAGDESLIAELRRTGPGGEESAEAGRCRLTQGYNCRTGLVLARGGVKLS